VAVITVAADFAAMGDAPAALPFIATDDGITAGEPTECFNPIAAVMRAEALSRKEGPSARSRFAAPVTPLQAISTMPR
jgi:hypothetical protein